MAVDGLRIEAKIGRIMEAIGAIFEAIMFFLGIYQEHEVTREQCERMWAEGYVVYPQTQEEYNRAQKCKDIFDD